MSWKYTTSKNRDSSQLKVVNICVFSNVLTSSRVDEPYFKRPKIAVKVKCEDDGEDGDDGVVVNLLRSHLRTLPTFSWTTIRVLPTKCHKSGNTFLMDQGQIKLNQFVLILANFSHILWI
jgi:hypothetical protein